LHYILYITRYLKIIKLVVPLIWVQIITNFHISYALLFVLAIHYGSVSVKQALSKFDIMLYSKQSVNTEQTVVSVCWMSHNKWIIINDLNEQTLLSKYWRTCWPRRMLLSCKVKPYLLGEKGVKEMALNYQEFWVI